MNPPRPILRILLIEDDLDDAMFFKDALAEIELQTKLQIITRCDSILEHVGHDPENLHHIIFLDLNMPLVSGHVCLREIWKDHRLDAIPVIIYSTSAIKSEVDDTFHGGASMYLQKPSSFQLLVIALNKILRIDWKNFTGRDRDNFVYKHALVSSGKSIFS